MILPFLCVNCKNWYVPVPLYDDITGERLVCLLCENGKHAANKAGVIDCHVGQLSATKSEITIALAYGAVQVFSLAVKAGDRAKAAALQGAADTALATIPEALRWAPVMEMPGMQGMPNEMRFKNINVIDELVNTNRRPPQDLRKLRRSERVCADLAQACVAEITLARQGLAALPMTTPTPLAPPLPAAAHAAVEQEVRELVGGGKKKRPSGAARARAKRAVKAAPALVGSAA